MTDNLKILEEQERQLQFDSFNHDDALKLGNCMIEYAKKKGVIIAISVCVNSGCVVFQYCPDGTNLLNQRWMKRKFNTVREMEQSSLMSALIWEKEGCTTQTHGLKNRKYALCGGGFPIRVKGSSAVIGAIIASNLYHIADHEFIIDCLRKYLKCPEVPQYPYECP